MKMYRQGDVLVERVEGVDLDGCETVPPRDDGSVVLAYGEATHHDHTVSAAHAAMLAKGAERFLRVTKPAVLRHQEHAPIQLKPGTYSVVIQREYSPEAIRNVLD